MKILDDEKGDKFIRVSYDTWVRLTDIQSKAWLRERKKPSHNDIISEALDLYEAKYNPAE